MKDNPDKRGKRTLTDYVYNALRSDILSGTYPAGASLVETRIAEELDVSRTPVREALRRLELEELVRSTPNKGMVVLGAGMPYPGKVSCRWNWPSSNIVFQG